MAGKPGACVFVPNDLRHTAATRWATDGMPLPVLAATLGHANLRSVMKYVHITAANIEHEIVRIEKLRLSRTDETSMPISRFDPADNAQQNRPEVMRPSARDLTTWRRLPDFRRGAPGKQANRR